MANNSNSNYIASIEQSVAVISAKLGSNVAESVFERYGAHDVDTLNPSYLSDVFSELYSIEADLR